MKRFILFCLFLIISEYIFSQGIDSSLATKELFYKAFNSSSNSYKIKVFSFLKKRNEKSAYVLFANAYLSEYNDSISIAKAVYNECIKAYPSFTPALYQLSGLENDELKSLEIKKKIVEMDFSFKNYFILTDVFFKYIDNIKNEDSAFNFLRRIQLSKPNSFIFNYLNAGYYYQKDQPQKANEFINKGLKSDSTFEPLLILKSNFDFRYAKSQDYFNKIRRKFVLNPSQEKLGIYVISSFSDSRSLKIKDRMDILGDIFSATFDSVSSSYIPLLIVDYYSKINRRYTIEAFSNLLKINQKFPNEPAVLARISEAYLQLFGDTTNSIIYANEAIKNSFSLKDKSENVKLLARVSITNINSFEIIEKELDGQIPVNIQDFSFEKYELNLYKAQPSFTNALDNLNRFIHKNEFSDSNKVFGNGLVQAKKRELQNIINEKNTSDSFYNNNNILKSWKFFFGNQMNISLAFEENTSANYNKNDSVLKKLKKFIEVTGIDKCVFLIEGHAASVEANPEALSIDRTKTIARYFSESLNVSQKNIRLRSFGDKFPIASNLIDTERAKNMRVDISPYWVFSEPKILATSALLANRIIAVSPDGNFIVTGNSPMQLWDLKLKILLKEFGASGDEVKFSPDGRYIATIANSEIKDELMQSALSIYDVKTGLLYEKIPWYERIQNFDWNPFSTKVAMLTNDGFIVIYDLTTKQKDNLKKIRFDGIIPRCLIWTKDGRYLINGYAGEKKLTVWNSENLQLVKEVSCTYWPHALQQSKDGNLLFCASNNRFLTILNLKKWTIEQMSIPVLAGQIEVHPYKNELLLNDWGAGERNSVVLIDFEKKTIIKEKMVYKEGIQYAYSPDGGTIYQALDDTIRILNSETLEEKSNITGMSYEAVGCKRDTVNNFLLSFDINGIHAIDITSGLERHSWNIKARNLKEFYGVTNRYLVTVENDSSTEIYSLDSKTFEHKLLTTVKSQIDLIEANKNYWVLACKEFSWPNYGEYNGFIEIRDTGFKTIRKIEVPIVTRGLEEERLTGSGFLSLTLSPDQKKVSYSTYWLDGFKKGTAISKLINSYNLQNGEKIDSLEITAEISNISYLDSIKLLLTSLYGSYEYNLISKKIKYFSNLLPEQNLIASSSGKLGVVWSNNFIKIEKEKKMVKEIGFQNNLRGVQLFEKQNLLIALTNSNKILFYDLTSFEERLTIVSKKENEWIAYTPQGNFQASLFGSENVFWSYGDDYIEFSQLKNENENTQLMIRQLASIKNGQIITDSIYKKSIVKQFEISKGLRIISEKQLKTDKPKYELEFVFNKTKIDGTFNDGWQIELKYRKNGTDPITEVINLSALLTNKDSIDIKKSYDLEDGFNLVNISLTNFESQEQPYRDFIEVTKIPSAEVHNAKKLFFLGIAIDNYKDASLTLNYPVKDAVAIARQLIFQKGTQYQSIDTTFIFNDDVGQLLNNRIRYFINQITANNNDSDVVIVYVAGHGKADGNSLCFLLNDEHMNDQIFGLKDSRFYEILTKLDNLPRDNKILFLDMCNADFGFDRPKNCGVIFPSCLASESAFEDSVNREGHGIFAAALLEGLKGQADKRKLAELDSIPGLNGNEDGYVELTELISYLTKRVYYLSKTLQYPPPPFVKKDYSLIKISNK